MRAVWMVRSALTLPLVAALFIPTPGATALAAPMQDPAGQQTQEQEADQQQDQERPIPNIDEVVVVTASGAAELLLEAPTAITVIDASDIALSPAQNYADLMRGVPGLNVIQTSARDVSMSSRSSTNTLDASQMVLVDGRTVYLDFFGFVAWDLLPFDFSEIEQIEVVRGPGSAVWGANALSGTVNIITKTPRQYGNAFRVRMGGGERGTGFASMTYSGIRGKTSFRLTGAYSTQDPWDRPGPLPNGIARDDFPNQSTRQPKLDARVDVETGPEAYLSFSAGIAGTGGTIHTGIGPFSIFDGTKFWYGRADYNWRDWNFRVYANIIDGDAINLLNGLPFVFKSQTYDFSAANRSTLGEHTVTYGGNFRKLGFDLSIAPNEDSRTEGGGFANFDLDLNDYVTIHAGARVDYFDVIDGAVTSPRGALLFHPTGLSNHVIRVGFGRGFRAPSLVNNFLDAGIFNAVDAGPPIGEIIFPSIVVGNPDLVEERLDQFEIGYRGSVANGRFSWDIAAYRTETKNNIDFYTSETYTAFNPPPGWSLPTFLLPPFGPVVLPARFSYRNIAETVNKGFEVGLRVLPVSRNTLIVNYSYQAEPEVTGIPAEDIGIPPEHRLNIAWNGWAGNTYYGASVNHVGEAYWTDVLDSRYFGTTDAYTTLDASLGYMFLDGTADASIRATNLTNVDVLQHVYGDIIGRRIVFEMSVNVR